MYKKEQLQNFFNDNWWMVFQIFISVFTGELYDNTF